MESFPTDYFDDQKLQVLHLFLQFSEFHWDHKGKTTMLAKYPSESYDLEDGYIAIPSIRLINIGNDVALDINVDWHLLENMTTMSEHAYFDVDIKSELTNNSVELTTKFGENPALDVVNNTHISISYIQKQSQENISLPLSFLEAITYYCYLKYPSFNEAIDYSRSFNDSEIPNIKITINYKNALNVDKKENLMLKLQPIMYQKNEDGSGKCALELTAHSQ